MGNEMANYSGITAEQARQLSSAAPASPEETLRLVETAIGSAAEQQQVNRAAAVLSKAAHSAHGVEAAVLHLATRGFKINLPESDEFYILEITW